LAFTKGNDSLWGLHKQVGEMFRQRNSKNTQQQRHPPPPPLCFSHMHAKEPLQVNYWLVFTQSAADKQVCN